AFALSQSASGGNGLVTTHVHHAVDAGGVEDAGHELRRPAPDAGNLRTGGRLGADDLYRRTAGLKGLGYAHDRAGRAHRRHEMRDLARRVPPDLRSRRTLVG